MALTDRKITDNDVSTKGVQAAPDKLTGTAAQNKLIFDRLITDAVKDKFNSLIDDLVTALAGKMAAPSTEGSAGQYLKTDGAGGRSWDTPSGSGDMLKSVYDSDNDGRVDQAESALLCSGNAATATKLYTARTIQIKDSGETHEGAAVSFDGSGNIIITLPATIAATIIGNVTGNLTGNADTATKLAATFNLSVSDGTHAGTVQTVDGSAAVTLPLPTTLDADLLPGTIVLDSDSYGTSFPSSPETGRLFFKKV